MRKKDNWIKIQRILGTVFAGTVMALFTMVVIYGVFWLLKMISLGIITVCDYIITFFVANWASSLGVVGMLAVGIIEVELIILPRFHRNSAEPNPDENSDSDSDEDEEYEETDDTQEALNFLKSFDPDSEE